MRVPILVSSLSLISLVLLDTDGVGINFHGHTTREIYLV